MTERIGTTDAPPPPPPPDTGPRDPVPDVSPELADALADQVADQGGADLPAGTGQTDQAVVTEDGGWQWKGLELSPGENRVADEQLASLRRAEGRNEDGSYGDEGITPGMREVEAKLEHGSLIPDTEKFALKSEDRFKEKLAKSISVQPDVEPDKLAANIPDGVRYTFQFDEASYSEGVRDAQEKLTEKGYELVEFRPSWASDDYKGINSRWRDPESGQLFEVQFHTPASLEAKETTHDPYEKLGGPAAPPEERSRLKEFQRQVFAGVPIPPGASDFNSYKAKAR